MNKPHHQLGESLIELILAMAIFSAVLPTIIYAIGTVNKTEPQKTNYFNSAALMEETKNVIQQIKTSSWSSLSTDGVYALVYSGGVWTAVSPTPNPFPTVGQGLTRRVTISSVYRDSSKKIVASTSPGATIDLATKKATISITWSGATTPITSELYFSRFDQIDFINLKELADFDTASEITNGTQVVPTGTGSDGNVTINNQTPSKPTGANAPVSWWDMNSTVNTNPVWILDRMTNNNTATFFPATVTPAVTVSRYGNAISLDGTSQYILIPSATSLNIGTSSTGISLEAVIRPTGASTKPFIEWNNNTTYGAQMWAFATASDFFSNIADTTPSNHNHTSSGGVTNGKFSHYAVVYTKNGASSTIKHYVDGLLANQTTTTSFTPQTSYNLYLGYRPTGPNYSQIDIDDVAVYNTPLTDQQVFDVADATYVSPPRDMGALRQYYSLSAIITQQLPDTRVRLRIGTAAYSGGCPTAESSYTFVGPIGDQSATDYYYSSTSSGTITVSGGVPGSTGGFTNPARCVRVKAYLFSRNQYDSPTLQTTGPVLKSVKIMYAL